MENSQNREKWNNKWTDSNWVYGILWIVQQTLSKNRGKK